MLHHHTSFADMWDPCTGVPAGQPSCAEDRATPTDSSSSHLGRLLHRRPRLSAPSRPPPPDAPLAPIRPPSIGRADAPMLHHRSTSTDMWDRCTGAPAGQPSCTVDRATPTSSSSSHQGCLLHRRPHPIAPRRPPPPPDTPLAPIRSLAIGHASRAMSVSTTAGRAMPATAAFCYGSLRQAGVDGHYRSVLTINITKTGEN